MTRYYRPIVGQFPDPRYITDILLDAERWVSPSRFAVCARAPQGSVSLLPVTNNGKA